MSKRHRPYSLSRPRAGLSSFSPPDTRGWRARGRCRRRFKIRISLRKCGSASRRATRTSLKCPGSFAAVFFRFAHSRKRNACAGPRFPGRRPDRGFPPIRGCREYPPGLPSFLAASPARNCGQASTAAPSASSWRAAHIGHQAEPRRRPGACCAFSTPAGAAPARGPELPGAGCRSWGPHLQPPLSGLLRHQDASRWRPSASRVREA